MGINKRETTMGELIRSIELTTLTLIKCDFEIFDPKEASNGGSIDFSCEVGFVESEIENQFEVMLKFEIRGFRDDEDLFMLEQTYSSSFKELDSDTFNAVSKELQVQYCTSLVYPTLRESAQYILNKAGLGQIDIPLHFSDPTVEEVEKNT